MILIEPRLLTKYEESKTISNIACEMREILRRDIKGHCESQTLFGDPK